MLPKDLEDPTMSTPTPAPTPQTPAQRVLRRLGRLAGDTARWSADSPKNAAISAGIIAALVLVLSQSARNWVYGLALDGIGIVAGIAFIIALASVIAGVNLFGFLKPRKKKDKK